MIYIYIYYTHDCCQGRVSIMCYSEDCCKMYIKNMPYIINFIDSYIILMMTIIVDQILHPGIWWLSTLVNMASESGIAPLYGRQSPRRPELCRANFKSHVSRMVSGTLYPVLWRCSKGCYIRTFMISPICCDNLNHHETLPSEMIWNEVEDYHTTSIHNFLCILADTVMSS